MNRYHTEQDREDGLTTVVCDVCGARHLAGTRFIYKEECAESRYVPPKRKFKAVKRTITYDIYAEVQPDGTLIIP